MCQAMEFRHLPQAGGIYDQNPDLLDRFQYIWMRLNEEREREEAERKRNQGGPSGKRGLFRRGRSH